MPAPSLPPRLGGRGLNFEDLDNITPEEIVEFRASQVKEDGASQSGFDYLLDNHPGTIKRHKFFSTQIQPPYRDQRYQAVVFGWLGYYGYLDFDEGVLYSVEPCLRSGFTREQILEGVGVAFMLGGTRSIACIGRALKDYHWPGKAEETVAWPEGWEPDPAAFASGLDFSTREALPGEAEKVIAWYERTIGWVPSWVVHWAKFNPNALKGWRCKYEGALTLLPKQVMPLSAMTAAVLFEYPEMLRENVLLARAWGAELTDVLSAIDLTSVYATEKISFAARAVGDLLEAWRLASD
jgi:hypothetical protein